MCDCGHEAESHVIGYYDDRSPCMVCECQTFTPDVEIGD